MKRAYEDGSTPLDPDEAAGLLDPTLTTPEELNEAEARNIIAARERLLSRRPHEILSERFVRTLHRMMFGEVWAWAGSYRRSGKNIGCDWRTIPEEVAKLLADARYWTEQATFPPDELAARFHHRLVLIHPFPNGNGRHARLMTDLLLEHVLGVPPFTWGGGDLSRGGPARTRHLAAMRAADEGDFSPLITFARS